jgi:hypothetical protein
MAFSPSTACGASNEIKSWKEPQTPTPRERQSLCTETDFIFGSATAPYHMKRGENYF